MTSAWKWKAILVSSPLCTIQWTAFCLCPIQPILITFQSFCAQVSMKGFNVLNAGLLDDRLWSSQGLFRSGWRGFWEGRQGGKESHWVLLSHMPLQWNSTATEILLPEFKQNVQRSNLISGPNNMTCCSEVTIEAIICPVNQNRIGEMHACSKILRCLLMQDPGNDTYRKAMEMIQKVRPRP